jgi:hypothetical protein
VSGGKVLPIFLVVEILVLAILKCGCERAKCGLRVG